MWNLVLTLRAFWGVCMSLFGITRPIICEQIRGPWGHSLCFISIQWRGHFAFRAWMPPWDGLSLISAGGVWCRIKTQHILSSATSSRSSLDFPLSHYLFILIALTLAAFKSLMILMWLVFSTKECVRICWVWGKKHSAIGLYNTVDFLKPSKTKYSEWIYKGSFYGIRFMPLQQACNMVLTKGEPPKGTWFQLKGNTPHTPGMQGS